MPDDQEAESLRTSAYRLRSELNVRPAPRRRPEHGDPIADGKGNKVFRQTLTTSGYGVASTDFQLAGQVNTGPYKIEALLGNTASEKTVTVENYVLPKFAIKLTTERPSTCPARGARHTQRGLLLWQGGGWR